MKPTKALTLSDVRKADEALTQAQIALMETIQAAYPIGTDVTVKIGRATLKVKITRHCTAYWSRPGDLTGKNVLTGKPRNFHYTAIIEGADD